MLWLVARRTNSEQTKVEIQLTKCAGWRWSWRCFGCQYFIYCAVPCVICVSTGAKSTSIRFHFWTVIRCDRCIALFGILPCASLDKRDDAPEALSFRKPTQNSRATNPACAAQPYRPVCIGFDRVCFQFQCFYSLLAVEKRLIRILFFFTNKIDFVHWILIQLGCDGSQTKRIDSHSDWIIQLIGCQMVNNHSTTKPMNSKSSPTNQLNAEPQMSHWFYWITNGY